MRKCISGLAIVLGSILLLSSAASADHEDGRDHENEQVCDGLNSGKIDTSGDPASVTVTAPEGQLISAYCVKAGSANQGDGPEYVTVTPPVKELTISHSSGKDVSHYSLSYVNDGSTTTTEPTTTTTEPVTTTTEPPVTTTEPPVTTTEPPVTVPPTTEPSVTQPPVTEPPTVTVPETTAPTPTEATTPKAPVTTAITERQELPHTGVGTLVLALGGIGLILLGVILTRKGASIS